MANNFSLGSRSMHKAGAFALNNAVRSGNLSFSSSATIANRWNLFSKWVKENQNVKKMESISFELVKEYGQELALMVEEEDLTPATAQNYLSAVNSVMTLATRGQWKKISSTRDCGIPFRTSVRTDIPASLNREAYNLSLDAVRKQTGERGAMIVDLCREMGLRSKEASLIDARSSASEARKRGYLTITQGTKGGRPRVLPIIFNRQLEVLDRAAIIQGDGKSLIPSNQSWREWREGDLRDIRESFQKSLRATGLHDLRAAYACERYQSLTGYKSPLFDEEKADRQTDISARQQIAEELGHGRPEVTNSYLGGNNGTKRVGI